MQRTVTVLGSTGSIGKNTIDLLKSQKGSFCVKVLTAQNNVSELADQAVELNAEHVVIGNETLYAELKERLAGKNISIAAGRQAIIDAAAIPVDWTMSAIVGAAGMQATLQSVRHGKTVALANKETVVCAGHFLMDAVKTYGTTLLPVDSEHNAIFQVLDEKNKKHVQRLILTASGGPFLRRKREELRGVTPEDALKHPTWSMGAKISVDSATMMNKSLELIEAHYLFSMPQKNIDILIHPQSLVHSMVEYEDGSILAQLGASDMRTPIAYTLAWPERMRTTGRFLDLTSMLQLSFEPIDTKRFPFVNLARQVLERGGALPIAYNAANEVAVDAFLQKKIAFSDIEAIVENVLQNGHTRPISNLEDIALADEDARGCAERALVTQKAI